MAVERFKVGQPRRNLVSVYNIKGLSLFRVLLPWKEVCGRNKPEERSTIDISFLVNMGN